MSTTQAPQPRPRSSTPASSAPIIRNGTPRSTPGQISQTTPAKTHSRSASGSQQPPRIGSQPMQHTPSLGQGTPRLPHGAQTPTPRPINGSLVGAATRPAGKTVPGISSAGKSLGFDGTLSRSVTPSVNGTPNLAAGLPAALQASPATSALRASGSMASLNGLISPSLSGLIPGPGSAMNIALDSMSNLGLERGLTASSMGGKLDDEERRKRLDTVLSTLRRRSGSMSREAIMRLGRRCDLDMLPEGEDKLSLAGKSSVVVDLHFQPDRSPYVQEATLQLLTESEELAEHTGKASAILQADLSPQPGIASINAKLDRFADNLERLASMDRLSASGANCFDAVFGVYKSLKRLYDHEVGIAEGLTADKERTQRLDPGVQVMCSKSGRPGMHARKRVGLSLDYWQHSHRVPTTRPGSADGSEMDVDGPAAEGVDSESVGDEDVFSLIIECEHCPPALYTPMRVSNDWLSERVSVDANGAGAAPDPSVEPPLPRTTDWQDPPPTYKQDPETGAAGAQADTDVVPLLPHVRFVARLEPPIVLPIHVAASICASLDTHLPGETEYLPASFDTLVLPPDPASAEPTTHANAQRIALPPHSQTQNQVLHPRSIEATRPISTPSSKADGDIEITSYNTRLYIPTPIPATTLRALPFAHPRQLIAILPVLRQYALMARILRKSVQTDADANVTSNATPHASTTASAHASASASAIPHVIAHPAKQQPTAQSKKRTALVAFPEDSDSAEDSAHDDDGPAVFTFEGRGRGREKAGVQAATAADLEAFLAAPPSGGVPCTVDATVTVDTVDTVTAGRGHEHELGHGLGHGFAREGDGTVPRIELVFPTKRGLKYVSVRVERGGVLRVVDEDVLGGVDDVDALDHGADGAGGAKDAGAAADAGANAADTANADMEPASVSGAVDVDINNVTHAAASATSGKHEMGIGMGEKRARQREKMAEALSVCEDLGMWVLWVRRVVLGEAVSDAEDQDAMMDET